MFKVRDIVKVNPSDRVGHDLLHERFAIIGIGVHNHWGMRFKYRAEMVNHKGTTYFFNDEDIVMVTPCRIHSVGGNIE